MKNFNHKSIAQKICKKFNLTSYQQKTFTYFKNEVSEIGFIEKIHSQKYLYTFFISFFDFEQQGRNDEIVRFAEEEYKKQKAIIDQNKQGVNICLELRATEINEAHFI